MPSIYREEELPTLVQELKELLLLKSYDPIRVNEFVEKHPWALKYVTGGFAESRWLRDQARLPEFDIVPHVPSVIEIVMRNRHSLPQVCYKTTIETDRIFYFRFSKEPDGSCIAISG